MLPCQDEKVMPLFYSDKPREQRQAAALCFDCPLFEQCKAQGTLEEYGVWGGVIEWDRPEAKRLARDRRYHERMKEREAEEAGRERQHRPGMGSKGLSREAREERNAQIITLRRHGVKHRDIAAQFGLHENMVKRICYAAKLGA